MTAKMRQKSDRRRRHERDVSVPRLRRDFPARPACGGAMSTGTRVVVSSARASLLSRPGRSRPRARAPTTITSAASSSAIWPRTAAGFADGRALLRAVGDAALDGQARDQACGSLPVGSGRDALAALAAGVDGRDAVGDMNEHEAQTEPPAELSRQREGAAAGVTVAHPADDRSWHSCLSPGIRYPQSRDAHGPPPLGQDPIFSLCPSEVIGTLAEVRRLPCGRQSTELGPSPDTGHDRARRSSRQAKRRYSMVPMTGPIICGVDDSESAEAPWCRPCARAPVALGRRLVLVRVVEPGSPREEIDADSRPIPAISPRARLCRHRSPGSGSSMSVIRPTAWLPPPPTRWRASSSSARTGRARLFWERLGRGLPSSAMPGRGRATRRRKSRAHHRRPAIASPARPGGIMPLRWPPPRLPLGSGPSLPLARRCSSDRIQ